MLTEVGHKLDHPPLEGAAHADVVPHGEVLHEFTEADAPGVGADGHVESGSQEDNGKDLIDAAHSAGVNLTELEGATGEELLEENSVGALFPAGNSDLQRG